MYRKRISILMVLCILIFAFTCVVLTRYLKNESDIQDMNSNNVSELDATVIQRAFAAKMLALLYYSHEEIAGMPETVKYSDLTADNWYSKYFYALEGLGLIWGEDTCRPQDNLTCREAESIYNYFLKNIYGYDDTISQPVTGQSEEVTAPALKLSDDYISADLWMQLYDSLRSMDRARDMKQERVFLMALVEDENDTWRLVTDKGKYYFDGYAMDAYTNTSIDILTDGQEIIYIYGQTEGATDLNSVLITAYNKENVTIFYNDTVAELTLSDEMSANYADIVTPVISDITIDKGIITNMSVYTETINDKVLAVTDSYIDLEEHGRLSYADNYHVYDMRAEPASASYEDISVGYQTSDVVLASAGEVKALLIKNVVNPDTIRVAIMTNGHKSLYHSKFSVTSDAGFIVTNSTNSYEYKAGETFTVNKSDDMLVNSRIYIRPVVGGLLSINSIKRSYGVPAYRGSIELALYEQGIVIINELPVEQYLYSVVPSEMPSEYGIEPLKAQAVCARGYAYMQINNCKLGNIGAHVDDSTSYQVYNNTRETKNSVNAVDATAGQVLQYDGKTISPYYFSTSCGMTADCSDVWIGMKQVEYLSGQLQDVDIGSEDISTESASNLSKEKDVREFLDNPPCETFDTEFAWYRWSVSLYPSDIRESLEKSIKARYKANPQFILTKNSDGKYVSKKIDSVGDIKSVKVTKRAKSGIITELLIKGSERTIKVISEYNIRLLLASTDMRISRNDDSTVDGLAILPSAFFYIDTDTSSGQNVYVLKGGGYGHGVGMSQNGAKAMADAGYGYEDILKHYYKSCVIANMVS